MPRKLRGIFCAAHCPVCGEKLKPGVTFGTVNDNELTRREGSQTRSQILVALTSDVRVAGQQVENVR